MRTPNCELSYRTLRCVIACANPAIKDSGSNDGYMSMKRRLCHSGHNASTYLGHIWIGDDLLDAAIQRFGRLACAKRNVSLVPGPLEARKRETKRRLANISQANGGMLGSFDPSLLAGINEKASEGQWRWQAPGTPGLVEPAPRIPWLGEVFHLPISPAAPASPQKIEAINTGFREEDQDIGYRIQQHAFLSRLGRCNNIDEIRDLASFFEIDVRKHSAIAFRQLYSAQRSLRSCLDFLEDTSLDDPYAQNLNYLLAEVLQQLKDQADGDPTRVVSVLRGTLVPWAESQLSLGKRSRTDVEELSIFIGDLGQLKNFGLFRLEFARAVLKGLRSSTVLGFGDLAPKDRSLLLNLIMNGDLNLEIQDLGLSLIETMDDVPLISRFLAESIRSRPASHSLPEIQAWQVNLISRISTFLQIRSQAEKKSIIRDTSRNLVAWTSTLPQDSPLCADLLGRWWPTVCKIMQPGFLSHGLEGIELERSMPSDRPDILASYALHLGGRRKARFVLSSWFASRLSTCDFKKLSKDLEENLRGATSNPPFLCMLKTVHDCGFLQHDFIRHVFQISTRMRMFEVMTKMITKAENYGIHIPQGIVIETIRQLLPTSPTQAYQIFRCDHRIPLESFPSLAVNLIEHPGMHASVVWQHQLKRPWQSMLGIQGLSSDLLPMSRAQFLDNIALAYSESSKLTARMARKQVTKCITCYRREGLGPLSFHISRALVYAGIIRPLREKRHLSRDQLTWVLSIVREVEGPKRADEIDRTLSTWREQLWKQDNPKRNKQLSFPPRRKPSPFDFRVKWRKSSRRYERVLPLTLKQPQLDVAIDSTLPSQELQGQSSGPAAESAGNFSRERVISSPPERNND